jgi:dihydrofolate reductase/thymidylate synthase
MDRPFSIVVAATAKKGAIGMNKGLPWQDLKGDMEFFRALTSDTTSMEKRNAVIMGRTTFENIPAKFRPLPGRLNIVLSSRDDTKAEIEAEHHGVRVASSLAEALAYVSAPETQSAIESVFVVGGAEVYREARKLANLETIYLTRIFREFEGADAFFDPISTEDFQEESASELREDSDIWYQFVKYRRNSLAADAEEKIDDQKRNDEELQYLNLIREIMRTGSVRTDRTQVGTLSQFGASMRFNLQNNRFPLLTTKKVYWKGVAEELLWLVAGCTNTKMLSDKGVHIWDANGSRSFLDGIGLQERAVGDLGPVYGFQWRHFGAEYKDMHTDYSGQGFDQLADVIKRIKTCPDSRRIIMSAWNPADNAKMALPPCHVMSQFYVQDGKLSCLMYQRSGDMGLGVPFNIASYSLLTVMIAHVCNLEPCTYFPLSISCRVVLCCVDTVVIDVRRVCACAGRCPCVLQSH